MPHSSPFPLPAHQTGRADFPHPAFRLASWQAHDMAPAWRHLRSCSTPMVLNTASLLDVPSAARRQLVAPGEKVTHVVIQVSLDRPVRGVV